MTLSVFCLLFACAVLLREVCVLHTKARAHDKELTLLNGRIEEMQRRLRSFDRGLSEVERLAASNNAALELQDVSIDNHEKALRAQENLSILHAQSVTRLEGRIAQIERNPFHVPVRRDN